MTFNPQPKPEKQEKKCKGTTKTKGFGCGKSSFKFQFGLCPTCLYEWATTNENGKVWYQKTFLPKVQKKVEQSKKVEAKKKKDSITDFSKKLQDKVNEIVRLIDIGQPCLARGYHANQIHAGHVFSRGSSYTIRYNLHNIHRQSAQSNHFQNEDGLLREGLVNEYGQKYYDFISELRQCKALELSNLEFQQLYKKACKIALELKKEGKVFDKKERIEKRNEINNKLGIYPEEKSIFNNG